MSNIVQFPIERGRGDFFSIDAKTWDAICRKGSVNIPIAYLILARGTGGDNITTSWSVNAIEQYTGISRLYAKNAVRRLIDGKFIAVEKGGSRPRYKLTAAKESADWIWLPNAIVDGARDEHPPAELLRQSASLPAIQLFVELYHAQSLAFDCGVSFRQLRLAYERHQVGQRGQYVVWGFRQNHQSVFHTRAPFVVGRPVAQAKPCDADKKLIFWDALEIITATGLAQFVGHVVDDDTDDAAIVHPYPEDGSGEPEERVISIEAHRAGQSLLTPGQITWAENNNLMLLPAERHRQNIQLMGLLRLKYRARTAATATWYDPAKWETWAETYQKIQREETMTYTA